MIQQSEIKGKLKRSSWLLLFILLSCNAWSQEGCEGTESKKAEKLLKKGLDKKNSKSERIAYIKEAIQEDEEYTDAHWELAEILTKTARLKGTSYAQAEPFLKKVIENCPNYHSSPYYYLGQIAMDRGEYQEAMGFYKQFYDFDIDDKSKYERRYDQFLEEAKMNYKWAQFFYEQYNNPVLFDPQKVEQVSTEKDEYLPLVSPDNEYMYFTRRFENKNQGRGTYINSATVDFTEEFSITKRSGNAFEVGEALPAPFNQMKGVNYGGATVSIDNKELYLTVCKPTAGMVNCDLYGTKKVYGFNETSGKEEWHWTELKNLGPNINTDDGWEAQPSLSKDGRILIFASAREGSQGIDIYESRRLPNGNWGAAKRIPEPISTPENDKTPFFHSDSRTLYYSSQGHLNHGGYDVFFAKLDENGQWSEPVNLGYPINSSGDEHGFVVSTNGQKVYFTSNKIDGRNKTSLNIYSFPLYEDARPDKVIMVKGSVKDSKGNVPQNAVVEVNNPETNTKETFKVDSISGDYTAMVTVPSRDAEKVASKLIVNIKSPNTAFESFTVSTDTVGQGFKVDKEVEVKEIAVGAPYRINDIFYSTNSADLTDDSKLILDEFADWLIEHPSVRIAVHGHTDNVGDASDNLVLSTDRAYSVKQYIERQGVNGKRLTFKGFGESKPVADNDNERGRIKNRRTEFVIVSK